MIRAAGDLPAPGCHCAGPCRAPVIMGRQMPCRRTAGLVLVHLGAPAEWPIPLDLTADMALTVHLTARPPFEETGPCTHWTEEHRFAVGRLECAHGCGRAWRVLGR